MAKVKRELRNEGTLTTAVRPEAEWSTYIVGEGCGVEQSRTANAANQRYHSNRVFFNFPLSGLSRLAGWVVVVVEGGHSRMSPILKYHCLPDRRRIIIIIRLSH